MSDPVRYLVLSDIHANLDALEAVLAAAAGAWDRVLVLGDLVGYGADPNAVIDRVRDLNPIAVIRGNHDKAACGLDDGANFNQIARFAAAWTEQELTAANRDYLRSLPQGPTLVDDVVEICHGAPFDEDYYLFDAADAHRAFESTRRRLCVFGHTHLPVIFTARNTQLAAEVPDEDARTLPIAPDVKYLLNPGSVGQPRDGDPRAAFGFYLDRAAASAGARVGTDPGERVSPSSVASGTGAADPVAGGPTPPGDSDNGGADGAFIFRRIEYNVTAAQRKISAAGLPQSLANRLAIGR